MHPPIKEEVIQHLVGRTIDLVSFAKFVIHVGFDPESRLSLACPFRFGRQPSAAESQVHEFPLSDSDLVRIVGSEVSEVRTDIDGTLEVEFSNGDILIAYANDPMYEAYTLLIDGVEYVV